MQWNKYQHAFRWDGSLRNVSILNTTAADWQAVIDLLRADAYPLTFTYGDTPLSLPEHIQPLFTSELASTLAIRVAGMQINCHFFSPLQIEFDLDPREVSGKEHLLQLFTFMRRIGHRLNKPVLLTHQMSPESVLFHYLPRHDTIEAMPAHTW